MTQSLPDRLRHMANAPTVPLSAANLMRDAANDLEAKDRYIDCLEAAQEARQQ